ncbi:MAG: hypothetical protein RLZZ127_2173, partial [Planctomycetota bacterium]
MVDINVQGGGIQALTAGGTQ